MVEIYGLSYLYQIVISVIQVTKNNVFPIQLIFKWNCLSVFVFGIGVTIQDSNTPQNPGTRMEVGEL